MAKMVGQGSLENDRLTVIYKRRIIYIMYSLIWKVGVVGCMCILFLVVFMLVFC